MRPFNDERVAVRLTSLPGICRDEGYEPIEYRLFREHAINGRIVAHQRRGIWHFYREDIAAIAAALRLARRAHIAA
jgi:hypothetical protein